VESVVKSTWNSHLPALLHARTEQLFRAPKPRMWRGRDQGSPAESPWSMSSCWWVLLRGWSCCLIEAPCRLDARSRVRWSTWRRIFWLAGSSLSSCHDGGGGGESTIHSRFTGRQERPPSVCCLLSLFLLDDAASSRLLSKCHLAPASLG